MSSVEEPDYDAALLAEVNVVNPKTQQVAVLRLWGQNSYEAYPLHLIVEGRIAGRAYLSWNDCTPKDWLDIDTSDGVAPEFHGQGWGTALYLGAALAADDLGYNGVVSFGGNRNRWSNLVWDRLIKAGLATPVESEEGFQHEALAAKAVRATGLAY